MTEVRCQRSDVNKSLALTAVLFALIFLRAILYTLSHSVDAQEAKRLYRIGYLSMRSSASEKIRIPAFLQELQKLGYTEGKNIVFELRQAPAKQIGLTIPPNVLARADKVIR